MEVFGWFNGAAATPPPLVVVLTSTGIKRTLSSRVEVGKPNVLGEVITSPGNCRNLPIVSAGDLCFASYIMCSVWS